MQLILSRIPGLQSRFREKMKPIKKINTFVAGFQLCLSSKKQVVRDLVRTIAHGVLFGALIDLDQSYYGEYELALQPRKVEGHDQTIKIAPDKPNDLHDELNDWVLSFSKFADEIAELIETKGGWEIRLKASYKV